MRTYKPHAQVAHHHSRRIDEVDGVPTTHTQHGWTHAWTVTDGRDSAAPLPFAAKKIVPAVVAVPIMLAVTLSAFVVALIVVTAEHDDQGRLIAAAIGAVVLSCIAVSLPALARAASRATRTRIRR